jgi:hypothetical protein
MAQAEYTSRKPLEDPGSNVLVVACSGHEFQPYLREFLAEHLKLPEGTYNLLAVPGGPHFMALSEYLPKFAWAGQRWVGFAVDKLQVRRIILVAHDGCAWYADERFVPALLRALGHGERPLRDHQRDDLARAAASLRASLPVVAVEAYFAAKESDGRLAFHRVA